MQNSKVKKVVRIHLKRECQTIASGGVVGAATTPVPAIKD